MKRELEPVVRQVIHLLVTHRYYELEALTGGVHLSGAEIQTGVEDYGRRLADPPQEAYGLLHAVRVLVAEHETWFVRMPLWTEEEGRSDLEVEMTVIFQEGEVKIELNGILVP